MNYVYLRDSKNLKKLIDQDNYIQYPFLINEKIYKRKVRIGWRESGYTYFICPYCLTGKHNRLIFLNPDQELRCGDCYPENKKRLKNQQENENSYFVTQDIILYAGEIGNFDLLDDLIDGGINLSDYF